MHATTQSANAKVERPFGTFQLTHSSRGVQQHNRPIKFPFRIVTNVRAGQGTVVYYTDGLWMYNKHIIVWELKQLLLPAAHTCVSSLGCTLLYPLSHSTSIRLPVGLLIISFFLFRASHLIKRARIARKFIDTKRANDFLKIFIIYFFSLIIKQYFFSANVIISIFWDLDKIFFLFNEK